MSKISEFSEKQNSFIDSVETAFTGIAEDIQFLNDKIAELQNSPGELTPEDQALLDALEIRGANLKEKADALNNLTPPKPPVE